METDYIKLFWQVEALRGQVQELERERERVGNLLWAIRLVLIHALQGLGAEGNLEALPDDELLKRFDYFVQEHWVFSRCPNAGELRCRPKAMQTTRDGDLVYCEDCGWDVRDAS